LATLLGREGDPESFRDVYPFNPALVQVLVAVSALLQRERTALRVMLQLLVTHRETLRLGDLVPLGDLFDEIASGDEPFTAEMKIHFDRARRLYLQKLLPLLERHHGLSRDEARALPWDDPRAVQFRGDDRLMKTLLLAALAPDVEALKEMTAGRLGALNHGSIRSPIPGGEAKLALSRVRHWATQVGEIRVGGDANPTIALQLSGVDTQSIVEKAKIQDALGNRKLVIKRLLADQLGLPPSLLDDQRLLPPFHTFSWRGTIRQVEVVFANIRELPFDSLRSTSGEWKVIIDLPFDTGSHTARDDLHKVEEFQRSAEPNTPTFCWVPEFFSFDLQADLGTYVVLDFLLTSAERFDEHASHLSAVDRAQARALLDNQRSQLRQRLISGLEAAYGVATDSGNLVGSSLELADRFQSLDKGFQPRPPAAANLRDALTGLLDQIFTWRFPHHPKFDAEVKTRDLKKVLDVAVRAAHEPQMRLEVEKELRPVMRQIANPLRLGEMHESA
ncbi:MAG TPA: phage resistance protein, partial [Thermoanaerobaculia bacterium]|nr:phage resistance protein [Thermoanaerobaculia bacterium]